MDYVIFEHLRMRVIHRHIQGYDFFYWILDCSKYARIYNNKPFTGLKMFVICIFPIISDF